MKKKSFLISPPTFLIKNYNQYFLIQKFINKPSPLNDRNISLIGKAVGKLHSIKKNQQKPLFLFIQKKFDIVEKMLKNFKFLKKETKLDEFINKEYLHFTKIFKTFKKASFKNEFLKKEINFSFLHGELTKEHFLIKKSNLYIIDWELSEFGDPAYDLAYLFNSINFKLIKKFLDSYKKYIKVENSFLKRIQFYKYLSYILDIFYGLKNIGALTFSFPLNKKIIFLIYKNYKKYIDENIKKLKELCIC